MPGSRSCSSMRIASWKVLFTSNFQETERIMREVLERTGTSSFLLPTFTHGYSVDNAVHERMFQATEVFKAQK